MHDFANKHREIVHIFCCYTARFFSENIPKKQIGERLGSKNGEKKRSDWKGVQNLFRFPHLKIRGVMGIDGGSDGPGQAVADPQADRFSRNAAIYNKPRHGQRGTKCIERLCKKPLHVRVFLARGRKSINLGENREFISCSIEKSERIEFV